MIRIENKFLTAEIQPLGAELISINLNQSSNVLWEKEISFWNRVSPILFPIVGRLVNDSFTYNGNLFEMKQHGFARDNKFQLIRKETDEVHFKLQSTEETHNQYPFDFELIVSYRLVQNTIEIGFHVKNLGNKSMPFSIGGHPGFAIQGSLDEYALDFKKPLRLEQSELIGPYYSGKIKEVSILNELKLENSLFENDAVVFKHPSFNTVTLTHFKKGKLVTVSSDHWDAIGFWTKKGAPFFCIEPWWGWADDLHAKGDIEEKSGIYLLESNQAKEFSYRIELH
jgi:galactose mutarotase-like enzyme